MYLKFYNLKEIPFNLEPDPRFIFANPNCELITSEIIDSIKQKKSFIVLLGDHGAGKTTVINSLIERLSGQYRVITLLEPIENSYEFIEEVHGLFEIAESNNAKDDLFSKHQNRINQILEFGENSILILDDAHFLTNGIFDLIQLFLRNKIKIILAGQNKLKKKLQTSDYDKLCHGRYTNVLLKNLNYEETKYYIKYRLSIAKRNLDFVNPFSDEAIRAIFQYSKGLPRRINILCNNALVMGALKSEKIIDRELIEKVKSDDVCYHEINKILARKNG